MQILQDLEEYIPFNEQEQLDKETMLYFLYTNPDAFDRENTIAHMSASAFIVNSSFDKVLFAYHNIYHSWAWLGGHADGDRDLLHVALKEVNEESGIFHVKPLLEKPFSIEILTVAGYEKNHKYVNSHLHMNVTYLLIAEESDVLTINERENKGIMWIPISQLEEYVSEKWMYERVYSKLIKKIESLK